MDMFDAAPAQFEKYSADTEFTKTHTLYKYPTPQSGYSFVGWNLVRPQFKDKETRRALTMALDRDAIINTFVKKMAIPTSGPFSPQSQQYNQACPPLPYDMEGARKLLAQAGWKPNSRGILERDGVEFKFDLSLGAGNPLGERMATYAKEQFRILGIDMSIQPYEFSVLMERMDKRNFDALLMGWTANIESDPYQSWHSSQIADQGDNAIGFRNAEADRIIEAARGEVDVEKRMKLWQDFHKIIYDEQPYTFLFSRMEKIFIDGRYKNTEPYKTGTNSDDWYVPADKQKYK
jgi:peptide/nickel transport system substrate-binding protein